MARIRESSAGVLADQERHDETRDSCSNGAGAVLVSSKARAEVHASHLLDQLARREFYGWDPYDALLSPTLSRFARSKALRQAAIQANRRSPFNVRRLVGIPQLRHSMSTAMVLSALAEFPENALSRPTTIGRELRDDLISQKITINSGAGYGYDFDVQTRWSYYTGGTPNAVVTAFVLHALLDHERLESFANRDELDAIVAFACSSLRVVGPEGTFFGYYPGAVTPIHNANVLIAGAVARVASIDSAAWRMVRSAFDHALQHQRPDGSWPYGARPSLGWVDGYHTAFILDGLLRRYEVDSDQHTLEALERGLHFYLTQLFDPDGAPRSTVAKRYPIDIHAAAFAVTVLARLADFDNRSLGTATRVLNWTLDNMVREDGRFAYQMHRYRRCSISYTRWSDAPMLLALASYLKATEFHG